MNAAAPGSARRTDLDLLRILVCAGVILGHALLIYAAEPRYHLKSAPPAPLASVLYEAIRITSLPIFFAIAGWSAVVALRRRTPRRFLLNRLLRVALPLAAGVLLLGPGIKLIELSQGRSMGMFGFELIPPQHPALGRFLLQYPFNITLLTWSHLWFLAYLCIMSLLLLPLLRWLALRPPATGLAPRAAAWLPALMFAALLAGTGAGGWNGYWPMLPTLFGDGANFVLFTCYFLAGTSLAAWPGLEARLRAEAPALLALAAIGFAGVLLWPETTLGRACVGLTAWGALGGALGLAARHSPAPGARLDYLGEATMPIYILHHLPLLLLGLALLPLAWPMWLTVPLIALSATAVTFGLYHWLVRPYRLPRLLLGMANLHRRPQATAHVAAVR